jgi:hypothetical protein
LQAKHLGLSLFVYHREEFYFLIPLFLCVKAVIPDFGQFCLAMGNNGSVASTIPNEGDCLVFCE